jgi:pimeloyl-ACP methyl ester carboxylesterase
MLNRIKNTLFQGAMKIFMPDLARQMAAEGVFELDNAAQPEWIRVEDNGADVTIFAFSGLDVLYAGLARYEFQNALHKLDTKANYVFLRDVHRMGFCLKPDGTPGGHDFYVEEINRVKRELGATHNIAIGSSIGGSIAFYLGTRCNLEQLVIFGAAFTLDGFTKPAVARKTFFDLRQLVREPRAYFELIIVTLSAAWAARQLTKRFGAENIPRPLDAYAAADAKPAITLYYGETAWPDVRHAEMLPETETVRRIPLPTGRHNTPAFLKQRGELSDALTQSIAWGLRLRKVEAAA